MIPARNVPESPVAAGKIPTRRTIKTPVILFIATPVLFLLDKNSSVTNQTKAYSYPLEGKFKKCKTAR